MAPMSTGFGAAWAARTPRRSAVTGRVPRGASSFPAVRAAAFGGAALPRSPAAGPPAGVARHCGEDSPRCGPPGPTDCADTPRSAGPDTPRPGGRPCRGWSGLTPGVPSPTAPDRHRSRLRGSRRKLRGPPRIAQPARGHRRHRGVGACGEAGGPIPPAPPHPVVTTATNSIRQPARAVIVIPEPLGVCRRGATGRRGSNPRRPPDFGSRCGPPRPYGATARAKIVSGRIA